MPASMTSISAAAARELNAERVAGAKRRRRISPEAGQALEILGHAIEYLADEYAHEGRMNSVHDGELEAIQLLMARNREIYMACPLVPTLWERCRELLGGRAG